MQQHTYQNQCSCMHEHNASILRLHQNVMNIMHCTCGATGSPHLFDPSAHAHAHAHDEKRVRSRAHTCTHTHTQTRTRTRTRTPTKTKQEAKEPMQLLSNTGVQGTHAPSACTCWTSRTERQPHACDLFLRTHVYTC